MIQITAVSENIPQAAYFKIKSLVVDIYNSCANWQVDFFESDDPDRAPLWTKVVSISGNDYNQWGSDDSYIVNFTLQALNLTKIS